jgi:hypothetical protein
MDLIEGKSMSKKQRNFSKVKRIRAENWECVMKMLLTGFVSVGVAAYADVPLGLVGGQATDSSGYAAFLSNPDGTVFPISGIAADTVINSVGMNTSGTGLIGGQTSGAIPYCAFVAPDGTLQSLILSVSAGNISSVAINETPLGLIGGRDNGLNTAYAAQVLSDGTVISLSFSADVIESVALNDSGVGLIGGEGSLISYAAYVDSGGTVTPVLNTPMSISHIYGVAINDLGNGIIAGVGNDFNNAYAAFVTPGGASPLELSPVPSGYVPLSAVAINNLGNGLIGGTDTSSNAYAGYALSDGTVITLFNSPFLGTIKGVALNDSGTGLIGGQNGSNLYAAFVQSDGTLTPLFSSSMVGIINSVAINEAGLGLIGGQVNDSDAYVALVAPNGTLTSLNILNGSTINSVALQSQTILNSATPKSIGPYGSAVFTQLAATAALEMRFIQQNQLWLGNQNNEFANVNAVSGETNIVYNEMNPSSSERNFVLSPKNASTPQGTVPFCKQNSFWVEPFGSFIHLDKQGSIPSLTNEVGGVLLGYDRQGSNYLLGATLGYAFNYVHYSESLGHTKLQEEMASLYGSYYTNHFWMAAVLWGGLYQSTNIRHTFSDITSEGKPHGWILQPHLELASPWAIDQRGLYYVEPFVLFDWVNNWQNHYTESGSSGLNVQMPKVYNSLLQSEAGLRFYERFVCGWGDFRLEEKISYVNQTPFNVHSVNVSFVSSASSFPVAVASSNVQNLGSVQILGCFVPYNTSYPYGGFSVQATGGSSYQSYFVSLFTGIDF